MTDKHIMVIDDTPENLQILSALLERKGYAVSAFPRGKMALAAAVVKHPDLVLLDINMPEMDGFEVCAAFKKELSLQDIPIIFISAMTDMEDKVRALSCGGVDYITKPFQMAEVYARVDTHLQLHQAKELLKHFNDKLKMRVAAQVAEINQSQLAMIFALAKLSHTRDDDTGFHLERVQQLCELLAAALAETPQFKDAINDNFIHTIYHASPLHDLGKVGISDAILLKPGRLTPEEFEIMKTHTTIGAETLVSVHREYPHNGFITMGIDIAKYHHEKWNGKGYPTGLSGEAIPLSARIMALVDVYEALRSKRPYKDPFTHERSMEILNEENEKSFDPGIVKTVNAIQEKFKIMYDRMVDAYPKVATAG